MNEIERVVLRWLESRSDDWRWFLGRERLDKKATIERFKKDKAFRRMIVEQVVKLACEMFERHKEEGK